MSRISLFFASLLFACAAHAAPPSDASLEALLAITKVEKLMDGMFAGMDQIMKQSMAAGLKGRPTTPEQQRALDNMATRMAALMRDEMSWDKLKPMYLQVYRESFTQEEIDGMIAFYKTPVGASTIDKMPIVTQKSMAMMQARMGPMMERMNAEMQKAVADAKAGKSSK